MAYVKKASDIAPTVEGWYDTSVGNIYYSTTAGWEINAHGKPLKIDYWFDEVSDPRHDTPNEIIERIRVSEESVRNDLRDLLIGLLQFERRMGYQSTTLVNEEVVDRYIETLS